MRKFDYSAFPEALLTPEISNLLSAIHEYRGTGRTIDKVLAEKG